MGFGKIRELTVAMDQSCVAGEQIAVICGNDRRMRESLQEEFGESGKFHILGFTDQVPLWLDACDVVYTKPGGLTFDRSARAPCADCAYSPDTGMRDEKCGVFCFTGNVCVGEPCADAGKKRNGAAA